MVEIIHYEKANNNKTIGYVDIKVEILKPTSLVIRKISHVQNGDRKFFNLPSFRRDDGANPNYLKYFKFENDTYNTKLLASLNEKVDEYFKKNGFAEQGAFLNQMMMQEEIPF